MSVDVEQQMLDLQKRISKLENRNNDQLSMVVFSGEMDKILAAMIIATGATAMDSKVKMFFTFWAIASLRDAKKKAKGKDFMSKMFGMMLPHGRNKLKLSSMNMGGMGPAMIKSLMKKKNVASLDEMFASAAELGVEICICEMSMNLMGFKKEEMIDYPHLSYCGVGTFLADADESSVQLFI
ncbi:MAG TPA: DsrE/DsrF/DrsH-like family protein [Williamwhitmania sp.]|nr:DsrE/DsrF/DrsH-like family protein [Williamwhitmania sp.]